MLLVSKTVSIIIGTVFMILLVAAFIGSYLLNKRTPKPEGCENLSEECDGCQMVTCSHHKANKEENE